MSNDYCNNAEKDRHCPEDTDISQLMTTIEHCDTCAILVLVPTNLLSFFESEFHAMFPDNEFPSEAIIFTKNDFFRHICVSLESVESIGGGLQVFLGTATRLLLILENPSQDETLVNVKSIKSDGWLLEFDTNDSNVPVVEQICCSAAVFPSSVRRTLRCLYIVLQRRKLGLTMECYSVKPNLWPDSRLRQHCKTIFDQPEMPCEKSDSNDCFCYLFE